MNYLCKMLGKTINDKEILEMDDITWNWHYSSWMEDKDEEIKLMRNFGCFVGAFMNPEAARKIQQANDDANNVQLSEEEFDAASDFVRKSIDEEEEVKRKLGKKKKGKRRLNIRK